MFTTDERIHELTQLLMPMEGKADTVAGEILRALNRIAYRYIQYGDLTATGEDAEQLEYYISDDGFADLMDTFLYVMHKAPSSGGLYCDGIVSKAV